MKNKKVILLILVMLVILTLVSVLVVQKLKKDEVLAVNSNENVNQKVNEIVEKEPEIIDGVDISDWKTYVNEEYEYSVRYPGDWEIIGESKSKDVVSIGIKDNSRELGYVIYMVIESVKSFYNSDVEESAKRKLDDYDKLTLYKEFNTKYNIKAYTTIWEGYYLGIRPFSLKKTFFEFNGQKKYFVIIDHRTADRIADNKILKLLDISVQTFNYTK